ncbi:hypothetical protein B0H10DRAFT_2114096 [Mycena sp. CBHHK59/15]|nr:hypothetical protein B0H10DRAFT_2114096 [Mycena sp. CBHHK59/15]
MRSLRRRHARRRGNEVVHIPGTPRRFRKRIWGHWALVSKDAPRAARTEMRGKTVRGRDSDHIWRVSDRE